MRTFETLFVLASDWSVDKWSVLIGRELLSRDKMERSDWLKYFSGGGSKCPYMAKRVCMGR